MNLYRVTIEMNAADIRPILMSEHELIAAIKSAPGKAGENARLLLHLESRQVALSSMEELGLSEGEWSLTWERV